MEDRHTGGKTATAYVPLETILESIPDPVLLLDESHQITAVNDAAGELFDCRPNALVGTQWAECCPATDREAFLGLLETTTDGRLDRFEDGAPIRIETLAGERRPVEITVERIYDGGDSFLFCQCREITEQIEREQTLRATIARLEALFEASPVPMMLLDADGTIERWNRAASTTFGWESATVTDEQYPLFTDAETRETFMERVLDGERIVGLETTHQGRDGSLVEVELYAHPLTEGGEVSSIIVSAIDVTELKQREQHLGVLHRIMRHTLRNKLNVIYAVGEEVVDDEASDQPDFSGRLIDATEELIQLSDQAERINSDLRRVESPAPVALDALLASVDERVGEQHDGASVQLTDDIPPVPVPDIARRIVEQLVDHAVENADSETPVVEVDVAVERRIVISVTSEREELTEGERGFLQRDESAALLHGSRMNLAHAEILASELGGQLAAAEQNGQTTVNVELPRLGPELN
ncbi:PAS domain-containing sensor histidine kinase [Halovenus halobia]|uniref:PAS domain-containing protein n=1 Tax=Halovenus halobia TaxID=3396622 RepID=UPI003F56A129